MKEIFLIFTWLRRTDTHGLDWVNPLLRVGRVKEWGKVDETIVSIIFSSWSWWKWETRGEDSFLKVTG